MAICWSWSLGPGEGPTLEEMRGNAQILTSKISGRKCLVPKKGTDKACESYKEEGLLFILRIPGRLPERGIPVFHEDGAGKQEAEAYEEGGGVSCTFRGCSANVAGFEPCELNCVAPPPPKPACCSPNPQCLRM